MTAITGNMAGNEGDDAMKLNVWTLLPPAEHQAIVHFAARHGRRWKSELREAWMTGIYCDPAVDSATLQRIRNTYGPSWLIKCRVPTELRRYMQKTGVTPTFYDRESER